MHSTPASVPEMVRELQRHVSASVRRARRGCAAAPRSRGALLVSALALTLAACGDTLVDHRNVAIQETGSTCDENLVLCGGVCRSQVPTEPNYVCGSACTPCSDPLPANATRTCTPVGPGGHDGVCGYACDAGLLRCDAGCCPPALVAVGGEFSCAATSLGDGGEVHCWGAGDQGQLGDGATADRSHSSEIGGLSAVSALAAGAAHACAISGGTTYCWGNRAGFGGAGVASTPVAVAALANADAISAGGGHTCVIRSGAVACTGALASGGGDPGLAGVVQVAAGDAFSCALVGAAGARSVWCWGANGAGQLGTGSDVVPTTMPVQVAAVPGTAQLIAAGARHACASTDAQTDALRCWGDNRTNQLGDVTGTLLPPTTNARVKKPVVALAAGGLSTCAVELDPGGMLACWSSDALAAGGTLPAGEPNHVAFGAPPGPLSVGGSHACFVEAAATPGRLRCFGHDERGQLGDGGAAADSSNPVLVIDR